MAGPAPLFREIHALRSYAHSLKEQLDRLPRQLKAQQARQLAAENALKAAQERVRQLKVEATSKEKTLKTKGELLARYEDQLSSIQSKKEFDAKQLEIAFTKTEIAQLEDEILQALSDGETEAARLPELEKALASVSAEVAKFEAELAPKKALWEAELASTQAKLKELEPGIPKNVRAAYDRTVASMGHDGFASVQEQVCGGCRVEITVQMQNELEDDQFVMCRSCGRILYLPAVAS
ncbi:MAG: C4-type zinc ribbon domain-containing protein [Gemmataceae bacterium]